MPWPFLDNIRPYIRMASYWLRLGETFQWIQDWFAGSPHYPNLSYAKQAIPEAARANYFQQQIVAGDPNTAFSRLWGWYARGAWYAGYGRRPTTDELAWAYQRPSDTIGLAFEITGLSVSGRAARRYTITVNAPWASNLWDVSNAIRTAIADGTILVGADGSEPLTADSINIALIGGALIARQLPTLTLGLGGS